MDLIRADDRVTTKLDFSVAFQFLEEICSRPFCLFYCFSALSVVFSVLLSFCIQSIFTPHTFQDKAFWTDYSSYISGLAFCAAL